MEKAGWRTAVLTRVVSVQDYTPWELHGHIPPREPLLRCCYPGGSILSSLGAQPVVGAPSHPSNQPLFSFPNPNECRVNLLASDTFGHHSSGMPSNLVMLPCAHGSLNLEETQRAGMARSRKSRGSTGTGVRESSEEPPKEVSLPSCPSPLRAREMLLLVAVARSLCPSATGGTLVGTRAPPHRRGSFAYRGPGCL